MIGPCQSCPWKVSTKTADIPGGGMDEERAERAGARPSVLMACHLTTDEKPAACAGWVERVAKPAAWSSGYGAIPMRLLLSAGQVDLYDFDDGGCELWPDMKTMLEAHRRGVR